MGQGNAIAHLMPPPFYAYRYVVAKARAPEESIQDQIDKVKDQAAAGAPNTRYKIEVMPGIYPEVITMYPYVDVVAAYGRVVIQPSTGTAGVTMASHSMLQGVVVDQTNQADNATAIVIGDKTNVIVEDCWVTGGGSGDTGISDASTDSTVIIRKCRIDSAATGYKKTAAGTTWLADSRITSATNGIDVDADDGTLNLMDNELMGTGTGSNVDVAGTSTINSFGNTLANTNTTGTCWNIADNANSKVYSHNDKFTKVTHAGAGFMIAKEEPQTYLVHNGMKIGDALTDIAAIGDASDTKRYMIRVFAGEYSESVAMAEFIDLVGESSESVVISQAKTNVITAAANSRIKSVRVELTAGTGQAGIYINNVAAVLEEVKVLVTRDSGTNYGIQTAGTGGFTAYGIDVEGTGTGGYGFYLAGSGDTYLYDSYIKTDADSTADIYVYSAILHSFNNKLMGTNNWGLRSDGSAIVRSHTDYFTDVTKGADGVMTCQEKPNVWRVFNGMEIADAHAAASAGDVIEVGPGSYSEALTISKALTITAIDTAERTTITQGDANVITLSAAATIQGFTINVSGASVARTGIVVADQNAHIRDCVFTQAGTAGYGITVTTGSPLIAGCTFESGLDDAIRQTGVGGTTITQCRILSGATNGVNAADGTITISHSRVNVAGTGLNASASASVIWADHCDITGTTVDIAVAAGCSCYADGCTYNDVSNSGTFADLTGCREYTCDAGLLVGEWVYASGADAADEAKADALATMPTIGVVVYKPTDTTCKVKNYGYLYDSTAPWTAGDEYWVSAATEGEITNVMPAVWPQRAGVAVATDRFKILIGDNLGLVHCNTYSGTAGLAEEEWVYISADDTVDEADASDPAKMNSIGVVVDLTDTTLALVKTDGKVAVEGNGWTANDPVYISATIPGDIVNVAPAIGIVQRVGTVKSDAGVGAAKGLIIEMM